MIPDFIFQTPARILFGAGKISKLGTEAENLGRKIFLVIGGRSLRSSGRLDNILKDLENKGIEIKVFEGIGHEPTVEDIEKGRKQLLSSGCEVVIAIGGGSVIDAGKAIAALAGADGVVSDYYSSKEITSKGCPFIAIPTTAGSGAEVTKNAVIVDHKHKIKASIRSDWMMPDTVIVDPELTIGLPPSVTAASGMDALCQGIESFVSTGANPLTETIAIKSIQLMYKYLAKAYDLSLAYSKNNPAREIIDNDIEDIEKIKEQELSMRSSLALGSLMAGMALMNARLGLVHGLVHPLGAIYNVPHGLGCAVLLPLVIEFNGEADDQRYSLIAKSLHLCPAETSANEAASRLISAIYKLNNDLHIYQAWLQISPKIKTTPQHWPEVISSTLKSGSTKHNPRLPEKKDIKQLIEKIVSIPNREGENLFI